ncbi:uncharacterized protein LOC124172696 [Ischnura elegans]|uniref:uncharacterized protein LOC124172696 n=1 Tax=Ischnura elegans TaxID=197161 RepID=UPI001ED86855|nr:uncharacterized protein LOC124172696 [Ischnura elegans]
MQNINPENQFQVSEPVDVRGENGVSQTSIDGLMGQVSRDDSKPGQETSIPTSAESAGDEVHVSELEFEIDKYFEVHSLVGKLAELKLSMSKLIQLQGAKPEQCQPQQSHSSENDLCTVANMLLGEIFRGSPMKWSDFSSQRDLRSSNREVGSESEIKDVADGVGIGIPGVVDSTDTKLSSNKEETIVEGTMGKTVMAKDTNDACNISNQMDESSLGIVPIICRGNGENGSHPTNNSAFSASATKLGAILAKLNQVSEPRHEYKVNEVVAAKTMEDISTKGLPVQKPTEKPYYAYDPHKQIEVNQTFQDSSSGVSTSLEPPERSAPDKCLGEEFFNAVRCKSVDDCGDIIDEIKDVNEKGLGGKTLLNVAVELGKLEWVEKLLLMGSDPNISSEAGHSALKLAEECFRAFPQDVDRGVIFRLIKIASQLGDKKRQAAEINRIPDSYRTPSGGCERKTIFPAAGDKTSSIGGGDCGGDAVDYNSSPETRFGGAVVKSSRNAILGALIGQSRNDGEINMTSVQERRLEAVRQEIGATSGSNEGQSSRGGSGSHIKDVGLGFGAKSIENPEVDGREYDSSSGVPETPSIRDREGTSNLELSLEAISEGAYKARGQHGSDITSGLERNPIPFFQFKGDFSTCHVISESLSRVMKCIQRGFDDRLKTLETMLIELNQKVDTISKDAVLLKEETETLIDNVSIRKTALNELRTEITSMRREFLSELEDMKEEKLALIAGRWRQEKFEKESMDGAIGEAGHKGAQDSSVFPLEQQYRASTPEAKYDHLNTHQDTYIWINDPNLVVEVPALKLGTTSEDAGSLPDTASYPTVRYVTPAGVVTPADTFTKVTKHSGTSQNGNVTTETLGTNLVDQVRDKAVKNCVHEVVDRMTERGHLLRNQESSFTSVDIDLKGSTSAALKFEPNRSFCESAPAFFPGLTGAVMVGQPLGSPTQFGYESHTQEAAMDPSATGWALRNQFQAMTESLGASGALEKLTVSYPSFPPAEPLLSKRRAKALAKTKQKGTVSQTKQPSKASPAKDDVVSSPGTEVCGVEPVAVFPSLPSSDSLPSKREVEVVGKMKQEGTGSKTSSNISPDEVPQAAGSEVPGALYEPVAPSPTPSPSDIPAYQGDAKTVNKRQQKDDASKTASPSKASVKTERSSSSSGVKSREVESKPDPASLPVVQEDLVEAFLKITVYFGTTDDLDFLRSYYQYVSTLGPLIIPLLVFLCGQQDINIFVDFENSHVGERWPAPKDPDGSASKAGSSEVQVQCAKRKVYIAADYGSDDRVIGWFTIALARLCMKLVFRNNYKPYQSADKDGREKFARILKTAEELSCRSGPGGCELFIKNALEWKSKDSKEIALISAVPGIIAHYGCEQGVKVLNEQLPSLFNFYKYQVLTRFQ